MRFRAPDMDVDEALETIVSPGVVVPAWTDEQTGELAFADPGPGLAE